MAEREPSVLKPTAPGGKGRGDRAADANDTRAPTAVVERKSATENEATTVAGEPPVDDADTVIDAKTPIAASDRAATEIDYSRDDTVEAGPQRLLEELPTASDHKRDASVTDERPVIGTETQAETGVRPRPPIPQSGTPRRVAPVAETEKVASAPIPAASIPRPVGPVPTEPMAGATALESPAARRGLTPEQLEQSSPAPQPRPSTSRSAAGTFYVGGFWRRLAAAGIDLAVILPVSMLLGWIAGALSGVQLPGSRHRGLDFWLDLLLASDPALIGGLGLTLAIAITYALIFQVTTSRTLGMRVLKLRIIDVYGDEPSTARSVARTAGYLAGVATLGLGFFWIGFDAEKRGIQDWVAGTYVVRE